MHIMFVMQTIIIIKDFVCQTGGDQGFLRIQNLQINLLGFEEQYVSWFLKINPPSCGGFSRTTI
jgi:hypothetical protein